LNLKGPRSDVKFATAAAVATATTAAVAQTGTRVSLTTSDANRTRRTTPI